MVAGEPVMRRRGALAEASVELTPLIDVVLLLLIFFMVSASFVGESRLGIELPGAVGEPRAVHAADVEISVHRDGAYRVNGTPVAGGSLPDLLAAIVEAAEGAQGGEVGLAIAADAETTHQAVVLALDAAGQAGMRRVSLLTRQPDDAPFRPGTAPQAHALPRPGAQPLPGESTGSGASTPLDAPLRPQATLRAPGPDKSPAGTGAESHAG